jgi:small subunit ribosomal protein S4
MNNDKCKKCRRAQDKLFLKGDRCFGQKCAMVKRPYAPGKKGKRRSKTLSEFGRELREKQRLKNWYGLRELQFKNYVRKVLAKKGPAENIGLMLMGALESRLDSVVFRLGFATSRTLARQLVSHNNFLVNGKPVNIPSYQVKKGDVIAVAPRKLKKTYFVSVAPALKKHKAPTWLTLNVEKMEGKMDDGMKLEEINPPAELESIFEYYAR